MSTVTMIIIAIVIAAVATIVVRYHHYISYMMMRAIFRHVSEEDLLRIFETYKETNPDLFEWAMSMYLAYIINLSTEITKMEWISTVFDDELSKKYLELKEEKPSN